MCGIVVTSTFPCRHGTTRHLRARREPEPSVQQKKATMEEAKRERRAPKERKREKRNEDLYVHFHASPKKKTNCVKLFYFCDSRK